MKCSHTVVQQFDALTWCQQCGSVRVNDQWRLSEHEQHEVRMAEACPICEFGDRRPTEIEEDRVVWRWSCGHWIDSRSAEIRAAEIRRLAGGSQ